MPSARQPALHRVSDATETQAQVLIVDDDPRMRALLAGELGVEGYGVNEACDGQSVLIHLRSVPTDLILLDWTLPDFSGVEICRRMRASVCSPRS